MPHPQLDNLVRTGDLNVEPADASELEGLVASASKRLHDANNEQLQIESRFELRVNDAGKSVDRAAG